MKRICWKLYVKNRSICMPYCKLDLNLIRFSSFTSLQLLMFFISPVKRNLWACLKWPISERNMGFFRGVKKRDLFFLQDICFLHLLTRRFFSRLYREKIKNNFHNNWRVFQIVKIKHSICNLQASLYYMQISNTYIIWTKEL